MTDPNAPNGATIGDGHKSAVGTPGATSQAPAELTFEALLGELEAIVHQLERGDLPLEQAVSLFERGIALTQLGTRQLDETEKKVEVLLGGEFVDKTKELDPEG
ncbi:MAG: exodeoxyribonuclease VII small subunit [Myxococcales bacterium]|nr:exodeoxyribonuclease VII small subunit [Myxococcales bacterium]